MAVKPLDYHERKNWVAAGSAVEATDRPCDLFYIYPTLTANPDQPLMDLSDARVFHKTVGFVSAQVGLFPRMRCFVPYVRQLEYHRSMAHLRGEADHGDWLAVGMQDAVDAFQHYLRQWNQGRPFVVLGHSQGARNLYHVLKTCTAISESRGLVAAYLPGMPGITEAVIAADFNGRDIRPAAGSHDVGVIAGWNTQTPDADNPVYSMPGGLVINPLNWRCDEQPAPASANLGAVFYHYREADPKRRHERRRHFCGAVIDRARGALVVDLPSDSRWDAHGYVGRGVLHMNDFWFFAENIGANAMERVHAWLRKHEGR